MPITEVAPPPAKRTANRSQAPRSSPAPTVNPKIQEYEASLRTLAGIGVLSTSFLKQPADGMAIAEYSTDSNINALANNATRNPYFGKVLDALSGTGGPLLETVTLILPLCLQILANHKVIPANPAMGIMPPEVMEAKAAQAAMEAQRAADESYRAAMASVGAEAA